jgi:two-component system, NarL family, nitrate/nitrite response regulator NarL
MENQTTAQNTIKVMIVDDHQMFIDGVKSLLGKEKDLHFVAEANSGDQALQILKENEIDFVITDINMPGMSGTELAKTVKEKYPDIKVMVLSMFNEPEIINEIIASEAEGYILKNTGKEELISAIRHIMDDGTFYSNEVIELMLSSQKMEKKIQSKADVLTKREMEILKLICDEYSTSLIAETLFISPRTVETHRKNIMHKTGCKTIVGLIKFAIHNQLVEF